MSMANAKLVVVISILLVGCADSGLAKPVSQLDRIEAKLDLIIGTKRDEDSQHVAMVSCRKRCQAIVDSLRLEFEETTGDAEDSDRADFWRNPRVAACNADCDKLPMPVSACGEY
jgi:hypothetical protein